MFARFGGAGLALLTIILGLVCLFEARDRFKSAAYRFQRDAAIQDAVAAIAIPAMVLCLCGILIHWSF
jgi:Ca2+/Na+ antiporter